MLQIFLYDSKALSLLHCDASGIWMISHAVRFHLSWRQMESKHDSSINFLQTFDNNKRLKWRRTRSSFYLLHAYLHQTSCFECKPLHWLQWKQSSLSHYPAACMYVKSCRWNGFLQSNETSFTFILWAIYLFFIATGNLNISPSNPSSFQFHVLLLI